MSWTDIFPVLDDELLGSYRAGVTPEERAEFEEWFGAKEVIKPANCRGLFSKSKDNRQDFCGSRSTPKQASEG